MGMAIQPSWCSTSECSRIFCTQVTMNGPFRHCNNKTWFCSSNRSILKHYRPSQNNMNVILLINQVFFNGIFYFLLKVTSNFIVCTIKRIPFEMKSIILNGIFLWDITCKCIFLVSFCSIIPNTILSQKKKKCVWNKWQILHYTCIFIDSLKETTDYNVLFIISDSYGLKTIVCSNFLNVILWVF